jgi:hypothetical protein
MKFIELLDDVSNFRTYVKRKAWNLEENKKIVCTISDYLEDDWEICDGKYAQNILFHSEIFTQPTAFKLILKG